LLTVTEIEYANLNIDLSASSQHRNETQHNLSPSSGVTTWKNREASGILTNRRK
jgi:hypothetical protein